MLSLELDIDPFYTLAAGDPVLARTYGACSSGAGKLVYAFPEPAELAMARPGSIRALGFSLRKATTIVAIADAANEGRLGLESLATRDDDTRSRP
jgi:3-methyladenine DNA glycosylase/8-oxoguanine DNA glycosylase